jgi:hypothetical protein
MCPSLAMLILSFVTITETAPVPPAAEPAPLEPHPIRHRHCRRQCKAKRF